MSRLLSILCGICVFCRSFGQHERKLSYESYDISKFKLATINSPRPANGMVFQHFLSVKVIDARPDDLHVGFSQTHFSRAFLTIEKDLQGAVRQYVHDYAGLSDLDSLSDLLMVIRKCWLSDEFETGQQENKVGEVREDTSRLASGIALKIEVYFHEKGNYFPLYRFDTTIAETHPGRDYPSRFLSVALTVSLEKLKVYDLSNFDRIRARRKLSFSEIMDYNKEAFDVPVLRDTCHVPGVYMSFEEFKNDRPSVQKFRLKKDYLNQLMYVEDSLGHEIVTRNNWGYCDGEHTFIRSADNYFLLQRTGNAFYFIGAKNMSHIPHSAEHSIGNNPLLLLGFISPVIGTTLDEVNYTYRPNYNLKLSPLQLDLDDGRIY